MSFLYFLAFFQQEQSGSDPMTTFFQVLPIIMMAIALYLVARPGREASQTIDTSQLNESLDRINRAIEQLTQAVQDVASKGTANTDRIVASLNELSVETEILEVDAASLKKAPKQASAKQAPPKQEEASHEPITVVEATPDNVDPSEAETVADATHIQTITENTESDEADDFDRAIELLEQPDVNYPTNLEKAAKIFESHLNGPKKNRALTLLSETYFWLGDIAREKADKERFHSQGVEYGKQSVLGEPNNVASHMWYSANMGSHGMARGIMSSLFYLGDMEKHGLKAMELDKTYFFGAPLRLMGRFYHQCPGWPVGKGDTAKGAKLLQEAVNIGPEFILNHLYLADVLIDRRKKREAKAVLEEALRTNEFTVMEHYQRNIQKGCNNMLQKL